MRQNRHCHCTIYCKKLVDIIDSYTRVQQWLQLSLMVVWGMLPAFWPVYEPRLIRLSHTITYHPAHGMYHILSLLLTVTTTSASTNHTYSYCLSIAPLSFLEALISPENGSASTIFTLR